MDRVIEYLYAINGNGGDNEGEKDTYLATAPEPSLHMPQAGIL
jgi:hypothetical protein